MSTRLWLALAGLALALAQPGHAEVTPQSGPGDPHIQTVAYDPAQVVGLHVAGGFALTVQFSPDERIETVSLGDGANWQVQTNKRADSLVIKPGGMGPATNLTVITDARAYAFALYGAYPGDGVQPYLLSFTYPAPPDADPVPVAEGRYTLSGARALWPVEMADDGAVTRIRWAEGASLPAIYGADGGGRRALINGVMRDGVYVVEGVFRHLVFLRGKDSADAKRLKPAPAQPGETP